MRSVNKNGRGSWSKNCSIWGQRLLTGTMWVSSAACGALFAAIQMENSRAEHYEREPENTGNAVACIVLGTTAGFCALTHVVIAALKSSGRCVEMRQAFKKKGTYVEKGVQLSCQALDLQLDGHRRRRIMLFNCLTCFVAVGNGIAAWFGGHGIVMYNNGAYEAWQVYASASIAGAVLSAEALLWCALQNRFNLRCESLLGPDDYLPVDHHVDWERLWDSACEHNKFAQFSEDVQHVLEHAADNNEQNENKECDEEHNTLPSHVVTGGAGVQIECQKSTTITVEVQ